MRARRLVDTAGGAFGTLLRRWRASRRLTQLQLALEADVSARHLGFLECGRARPSREMVLVLAAALEVPLREQNLLLQAAGFAPIFRETDLAAPQMAGIRTAIELILRGHEPSGAIAMTHRWDVVMANRPQAMTLTALVGYEIPAFRVLDPPRPNVLTLLFEPQGLRQMLVNWEAVARETLNRARRDAVWARDARLDATVRELAATLPPIAESPDYGTAAVLPVDVRQDDTTLRLFSTVTTLGAPQDVTLQELRIEAFHPADTATERVIRESFAQLRRGAAGRVHAAILNRAVAWAITPIVSARGPHSLNRLPAGHKGCPTPEAMSSSTRLVESLTRHACAPASAGVSNSRRISTSSSAPRRTSSG